MVNLLQGINVVSAINLRAQLFRFLFQLNDYSLTMQKALNFLLSILLIGLFGCEDDQRIDLSDLPQRAQDYVNLNYANLDIVQVEREDSDDGYCYEVELQDEIDLYFDCEGNFLFRDDGRLGIIDFGCVKTLPQAFPAPLTSMMIAISTAYGSPSRRGVASTISEGSGRTNAMRKE